MLRLRLSIFYSGTYITSYMYMYASQQKQDMSGLIGKIQKFIF